MRRIIDGPRPTQDQPPVVEPKHNDDVRGYTQDLHDRFPQGDFRHRLSGVLTKGIGDPRDLEIASVLIADAYGSSAGGDGHDEATDQNKGKERRRQAARFSREMLDSTYIPREDTDPFPDTFGDTLTQLKDIRAAHLGDRAMSELQRAVTKATNLEELAPIIDASIASFATVLGEAAHRVRDNVAITKNPELTKVEQEKMRLFKIVDSLVRTKDTLARMTTATPGIADTAQQESIRELALTSLGIPESFFRAVQERHTIQVSNTGPKEGGPTSATKERAPTNEKREMTPEQIVEEVLRVGGFQIHSRFHANALKNPVREGFQTIGSKLVSDDTSRTRGQWILHELNANRKGHDKHDDFGDLLKEEKIREVVGISPVEHLTKDEKPTIVPEQGIRFEDAIQGADPTFGKEKAIQFFYHTSGSEWRHADRGGQAMECTIVLPESLARLFEKTIRENPTVMRSLVERHVKQELLKNPDDWGKTTGSQTRPETEPWCKIQPPWDMWDKPEAGMKGMYIRKKGSPGNVDAGDIIPISKK